MTTPTPRRRRMYRQAEILPAARGQIWAVLCTDRKLEDGLALVPSGCDLARFRRNPALMTGHDYRKVPVGRVPETKVELRRLLGRLEFARDDHGQMLETRVRDGIINGVSIGYAPDWDHVDRFGTCTKWMLTEVSLVGVPMDDEALIYSRASRRPCPCRPGYTCVRCRRRAVRGSATVSARDAAVLRDAFDPTSRTDALIQRLAREVLDEHLAAETARQRAMDADPPMIRLTPL